MYLYMTKNQAVFIILMLLLFISILFYTIIGKNIRLKIKQGYDRSFLLYKYYP
jgi:membrane protein CcdC involved in cytochrome C biogenesis